MKLLLDFIMTVLTLVKLSQSLLLPLKGVLSQVWRTWILNLETWIYANVLACRTVCQRWGREVYRRYHQACDGIARSHRYHREHRKGRWKREDVRWMREGAASKTCSRLISFSFCHNCFRISLTPAFQLIRWISLESSPFVWYSPLQVRSCTFSWETD